MKRYASAAIAAAAVLCLSAIAAFAEAALPSGVDHLVACVNTALPLVPNGVAIAALVSLGASVFCMVTPTPAAGSPISYLYAVIELLAANVGHAKDPGAPALLPMTLSEVSPVKVAGGGLVPALVVFVGVGFGLLACAGAGGKLAAFAAEVEAYTASAETSIAAFNAGAATDLAAVSKAVCAGGSMANGLFKAAAPIAGADPAALGVEDAAFAGLEVYCDRVNGGAPSLTSDLVGAIGAYSTIKSGLAAVQPAAGV